LKKIWPAVTGFLRRADTALFVTAMVSAIYGIVVISSATKTMTGQNYVMVQTLALVIGIALFAALTVIDVEIIADNWLLSALFSAALIAALIPFGKSDDTGNKAWIRFLGIGLQPAEIVKITYIIIMAKLVSDAKYRGKLNSPLTIIKTMLMFGFFFALIVLISGDLGSALVYLVIFVTILFAAGVRLYWFAVGLAATAAATPLIWTYALKDYQKLRILAPYVPEIDPTGNGLTWQVNHSKIALASGQLTGTGLYNGTQSQSDALYSKQADFIFGVIGEELGLIGCLAVVALLSTLIIRCVYVGVKSKDTLNLLVCCGVASMLFFQTFENIGMCMGLAPVIGVTLPLFSYGGSSLFTTFAALGIVSGIKYRPKPEKFISRMY